MFGKGQNSNSIISQLDFAIKNNQKVFHMSGGEQLRDYLPVEKAAEKLSNLYKSGNQGIFNICSGKPISIKNLVESFIEKKNSVSLRAIQCCNLNTLYDLITST